MSYECDFDIVVERTESRDVVTKAGVNWRLIIFLLFFFSLTLG